MTFPFFCFFFPSFHRWAPHTLTQVLPQCQSYQVRVVFPNSCCILAWIFLLHAWTQELMHAGKKEEEKLWLSSRGRLTYTVSVKGSWQESRASPGSGSVRSTEPANSRTGVESSLPKKAGKLVSLLTDLLRFPRADKPPVAEGHRLTPYESMSPALGNQLRLAAVGPLQESRQEERAAIYENCFKCQVVHCHPLPRALPAKTYSDRHFLASQTFPNGLNGRTSQEEDSADEEELLYEVPRDVAKQRWCEEKSQTATSEGKRLHNFRSNPWCLVLSSGSPFLHPFLSVLLLSSLNDIFPFLDLLTTTEINGKGS